MKDETAACGDILGAAVEGSSSRDLRELYGEVRDFTEVGRGAVATRTTRMRRRIGRAARHGAQDVGRLPSFAERKTIALVSSSVRLQAPAAG